MDKESEGFNVGNVLAVSEKADGGVNEENTPAMTNPSLLEAAQYPSYAEELSRLDTLCHWPKEDVISSSNLAKAGFFYEGRDDQVRCFFCDGELRNWVQGDNAWNEHARWFPRCGIVRQRAESRMSDTHVQAVMAMEFPRELVQKVVEDRFQTTGENFLNVQDLLDAISVEEDTRWHGDADLSAQPPQPQPDVQQQQQEQQQEEQQQPSQTGETQEGPAQEHLSECSTTAGTETHGKKGKRKRNRRRGANNRNDPYAAEGPNVGILNSSKKESRILAAEQLKEENKQLKDQRTCKVCMDGEACMVFLLCGHHVCCSSCAMNVTKCPICSAVIRGTVRAILS